jgi:hypothetical protein
MAEPKLLNACFFDCESLKLSTDFPDGWGSKITNFYEAGSDWDSNVFFMGVGVAATHDNQSLKFWTKPVEILEYLLSDEVDAIVTYNGEHFDFPLLLGDIEPPVIENGQLVFSDTFKEMYRMLGRKSIDVCKHVKQVIGHPVKLSNLIQVLRGEGKLMDGTEWMSYFLSEDIDKRITAINYLVGDVIDLKCIYGVMVELHQYGYYDSLGNLKVFSIRIPTPAQITDNVPF